MPRNISHREEGSAAKYCSLDGPCDTHSEQALAAPCCSDVRVLLVLVTFLT